MKMKLLQNPEYMTTKAFTLIEVAIALAILSSVTVSVLLVRNKLLKHSQRTKLLASANVLAGRLVARCREGAIDLQPNRPLESRDVQTGFYWRLDSDRNEVRPNLFLRCLKIRIYEEYRSNEPLVSFKAYLPLEPAKKQRDNSTLERL